MICNNCGGYNEEMVEGKYVCHTDGYKIENLSGNIIYVDTLRVHDMPSDDGEIGDAQNILFCPTCYSWRNR